MKSKTILKDISQLLYWKYFESDNTKKWKETKARETFRL